MKNDKWKCRTKKEEIIKLLLLLPTTYNLQPSPRIDFKKRFAIIAIIAFLRFSCLLAGKFVWFLVNKKVENLLITLNNFFKNFQLNQKVI